jgi:hypothetical protein
MAPVQPHLAADPAQALPIAKRAAAPSTAAEPMREAPATSALVAAPLLKRRIAPRRPRVAHPAQAEATTEQQGRGSTRPSVPQANEGAKPKQQGALLSAVPPAAPVAGAEMPGVPSAAALERIGPLPPPAHVSVPRRGTGHTAAKPSAQRTAEASREPTAPATEAPSLIPLPPGGASEQHEEEPAAAAQIGRKRKASRKARAEPLQDSDDDFVLDAAEQADAEAAAEPAAASRPRRRQRKPATPGADASAAAVDADAASPKAKDAAAVEAATKPKGVRKARTKASVGVAGTAGRKRKRPPIKQRARRPRAPVSSDSEDERAEARERAGDAAEALALELAVPQLGNHYDELIKELLPPRPVRACSVALALALAQQTRQGELRKSPEPASMNDVWEAHIVAGTVPRLDSSVPCSAVAVPLHHDPADIRAGHRIHCSKQVKAAR